MIHDDVLDADVKQQRFNNYVFDTKGKNKLKLHNILR